MVKNWSRGVVVLLALSGLMLGLALPARTSGSVTEEWVQRHNGTANDHDFARVVKVDAGGNVYVAGTVVNAGSSYDYHTIKYNNSGVLQWQASYSGIASQWDQVAGMAVDAAGNVYVTGESPGDGSTDMDYATVKYNSDGVQQWVARYNSPANGPDYARAIGVDPSGNVFVTGFSRGPGVGTGNDYLTVKYNSAGVEQWTRRYNGDASGHDEPTQLALDADGNVLVTGYSIGNNYDYVTIKYANDGTQQWVQRYNGPGNTEDRATAVGVDAGGNVFVTGFSWNDTTDYATIKYSAAGEQQWVRRYNGPGNAADEANALVVDGSGNVYVAGGSQFTSLTTHYDYATVKYSNGGTEQWVARYNGPGNNHDRATALALDAAGNPYVTGYSPSTSNLASDAGRDYATIAYNSAGAEQWVARYDGPGGRLDEAASIAVDGSGNVFVTGTSSMADSNSIAVRDYATIKYSQAPADTTPPALASLGVGTAGASNGLPYLRVQATDAGSGVLKVQLTANSTNCHLEYPLGTRVVPEGTPRPHTLILPSALSSVTVYAVKDTNATSRVEMRAWDAANNSSLADPVIANLEVKRGRRVARTFTGIPAFEHYITLQNGAPGLSDAALWVNGRIVWRGGLESGQVINLNVAEQMRPGNRNTVRIVASGAKGAKAVLLIGDASLVSTGERPVPETRSANLEFSR